MLRVNDRSQFTCRTSLFSDVFRREGAMGNAPPCVKQIEQKWSILNQKLKKIGWGTAFLLRPLLGGMGTPSRPLHKILNTPLNLFRNGVSHSAMPSFTPQPQTITYLWSLFICRSSWDAELAWEFILDVNTFSCSALLTRGYSTS